ncbi:MAG: hypothetical protein EHM35_18610 [Planctomycetaceae bacterium]|nr:MAG: hypothetical protein EHM35_18610 [Planctomycetaceae bacterium]
MLHELNEHAEALSEHVRRMEADRRLEENAGHVRRRRLGRRSTADMLANLHELDNHVGFLRAAMPPALTDMAAMFPAFRDELVISVERQQEVVLRGLAHIAEASASLASSLRRHGRGPLPRHHRDDDLVLDEAYEIEDLVLLMMEAAAIVDGVAHVTHGGNH